MERLDRQRPPVRFHTRRNTRPYRRGYAEIPHGVWGERLSGGSSGGGDPAHPTDTLGPGVVVWWHDPATQYYGVTVGPPLVGDAQYAVDMGDGFANGNVYTSGLPNNADYGSQYNVNGTYDAVLYEGTPESLGAVYSTHTFVVTDMPTQQGTEAPLLPGDPGAYTIAIIEAWVDEHADQADEVLSAEQARATPRVTLVDWLEGFISHRDEGTLP